jgi:CDP-diacylglycerol--glycerol-3-phosphate 3-phosphatidyltransferase
MRPWGRTLIAIATVRALLGLSVLLLLQLGGSQAAVACVCLVVIAQLSDRLDGWLARRWSTPSTAGYLQDSVADKLFHFGCLLGLALVHPGLAVLVWGVLVREFVIMGFRVIAPDLTAHLRAYKASSVIFTALLRGGILLFIVALLAPVPLGLRLEAGGYFAISLAVLFGWGSSILTLATFTSKS